MSYYPTYYQTPHYFWESSTFIVLMIILYVILFIANWKIFTKAGHAGWLSIIPFVNLYVICKIVWGKGWYLIWFLIPFVNIIASIILSFALPKRYGKGIAFGFGMLFFPYIFTLILGFGSSEYQGLPD